MMNLSIHELCLVFLEEVNAYGTRTKSIFGMGSGTEIDLETGKERMNSAHITIPNLGSIDVDTRPSDENGENWWVSATLEFDHDLRILEEREVAAKEFIKRVKAVVERKKGLDFVWKRPFELDATLVDDKYPRNIF